MKIYKLRFAAFILAAIAAELSAAAPVVSAMNAAMSGTTTEIGGNRFRSFAPGASSQDVYLGVPDLGNSARRAQFFLGSNWAATNKVTFTYDRPNNRLLSTVDVGGDGTVEFSTGSYVGDNATGTDYSGFAAAAQGIKGYDVNSSPLNWMGIKLRTGPTQPVALNNVMLDGISLGSFSLSGDAFGQWNVTNYLFSKPSGFSITADLVLSGSSYALTDGQRAEIVFGYNTASPIPAVPAPAAALLGLIGLGTAAWTKRRS